MRRAPARGLSILSAIAAAVIGPIPAQASVSGPTMLGTLGGDESCAIEIVDSGRILGVSKRTNAAFDSNAFLFVPGSGIIDFDATNSYTPPGDINAAGDSLAGFALRTVGGTVTKSGVLIGPLTRPTRLNDRGDLAGSFFDAQNHQHAMVWNAATGIRDLGSFAGFGAEVTAINELGQAVGVYKTAFSEPRGFFADPVAGVTDLGLFAPTPSRNAINDAAQVIGQDAIGAALWQPGVGITRIEGLAAAGTNPMAINEQGEVAGFTRLPPGNNRVFAWSEDTGPLDTGMIGIPFDINDHGQIVGATTLGPAFVWDRATGATSLPSLPGIPFPRSSAASANNLGQIAGCTQVPGSLVHLQAATWSVPVTVQIHWTAAEYARLQQISGFYGSTTAELPKVGVAAIAFIIGLIPSPTPTPIVLDPAGTDVTQTIVWQPDELVYLEKVKERFALDDEDAHRFAVALLGYLAAIQGH